MRHAAVLFFALACSCAFTPPQPEVIAVVDIGEPPLQAEGEAIVRSYWQERAKRMSADEPEPPAIAAVGELERGWYRVTGGFRYAWALPVTCATPGGSLTPLRFYFLGSKLVAYAGGNQCRMRAEMNGGGRTAEQAGIVPTRAQPRPGADGWIHTGN